MSQDLRDVPASLEAILEGLRARRVEVALAIQEHVLDAVPDGFSGRDAAFRAGMLEAIAAVLDQRLQAIENGPRGPFPALPEQAVLQARRAARAGLGLGTVLRRYVAGHRFLGELIAAELERAALPDAAALLLRVRAAQEAHLEHLSAAIEHVYEQERLHSERSPHQRRLALVQRLLAGEDSGTGLATLGYEPDRWHLAAILTGPGAQHTLERLRSEGHVLAVPASDDTVWAWLATTRPLAAAHIARLHERDPGEVLLALGEPAAGLGGWRTSHRQAQDALRLQLLEPQACVRYADAALLAPWLARPERARALVELFLSPLRLQRDGRASARATLSAYFQADRNVSAAARLLGIDRRTLAYRLRRIEECLGHPLHERHAELAIALRLAGLLDRRERTNGKHEPSVVSKVA